MIENDLKRAAVSPALRFPHLLKDLGRMPPESDDGRLKIQSWLDTPPTGEGDMRMRDFMNILDVDGNPINSPYNQETSSHALSSEGMTALQEGEPWLEIISEEEERVLVYNQPAIDDGKTVAIVQVSRSLADRDRSLQSLGITLIVGSVLTTLAAFGGGWFLAGTTLKPVIEMTQTAHAIGQSRDFSARVQYEGPEDEIGHLAMTFNEMLSQLEDGYHQVAYALQMQREFVADVSHELRTPLTTIRGNLDLLQRDRPLPKREQVDILSDLTSESERLSRLVSDLLVLARAEVGRILPCEKVNISSVINDAVRQMRLLDSNCDIVIGNDTVMYAHANEDAFKQVLLIILDNAIKYAKCPINLDMVQTEHNVIIRITDSGPGMSDQQVKRIFDRFYRGDASRSSPGFGLGLSIAQTLVQAQHGSIKVESEVGKGSTFTITIPVT
jgi:signal transduction histidine kinase